MSDLISHLLVYVPAYNEYPLEKARKRFAGYVERLETTRAAQLKAIPTFETYLKNVAQPRLESYIKSLNPAFVSRAGLNYDELINQMREKVLSRPAYENYRRTLSVEKIRDRLPNKTAKYVTTQTFGAWRLAGPLTGDGASALKIVLGWLGGDKKMVKALRAQDKLLQGPGGALAGLSAPMDTRLTDGQVGAQAGDFKRNLRTQLTRGLDIIQCAHYQEKVVRAQNDRLKQLLDGYARPGWAVSINWTVKPESIRPADSKEVKEIEYKIYEFFLGAGPARKLRATWIEKDYRGTPINPNEYLGNPDQQAYFDMELEIQVSGK